jgi:predicted flap endonuclease-1-like 5' DNA nuclease
MTIVIGLLLVLLGLAIGFVLAWAFNVGISTGLFVGVLLVVAGAIIGFISEWLIDEAYRRNRELQRQLSERATVRLQPVEGVAAPVDQTTSEALAEFLRRRDEDVREMRQDLEAASAKLGGLQEEFEAYQQTHPDDLTVIKGIGPVYQWKLRDAGFNTYKQLSAADPEQLRRMLDVKNWQRVNVESWIHQARDWAGRGSGIRD